MSDGVGGDTVEDVVGAVPAAFYDVIAYFGPAAVLVHGLLWVWNAQPPHYLVPVGGESHSGRLVYWLPQISESEVVTTLFQLLTAIFELYVLGQFLVFASFFLVRRTLLREAPAGGRCCANIAPGLSGFLDRLSCWVRDAAANAAGEGFVDQEAPVDFTTLVMHAGRKLPRSEGPVVRKYHARYIAMRSLVVVLAVLAIAVACRGWWPPFGVGLAMTLGLLASTTLRHYRLIALLTREGVAAAGDHAEAG